MKGINKTNNTITVFIIIICLIHTVNATEIEALVNDILKYGLRAWTVEEYENLLKISLNAVRKIDLLILENPDLMYKEKEVFVNNSITGKKIEYIREICKGLIDFSLVRGKKVGLVSFSETSKIESYLSKNREDLYFKIDMLKPYGSTCIDCGINKGIEVLYNEKNAKDLILLTDGYQTEKILDSDMLTHIKNFNVRVHTIALGDKTNLEFLKEISQNTGGEFFYLSCENSSKQIYREIAEKIGDAVLVIDTSSSMDEGFLVECSYYREICGTKCLINKIILLLEPVYVILIILVGFYLIFLSSSPAERAKAKSSFKWLIASMCIVTLSTHIMTLLFTLSHALTLSVLSQKPENFTEVFSNTLIYIFLLGKESITMVEKHSFPLIIFPLLLVNALLFALTLRYYIVMILSILFPITISLYSFLPTRYVGRLLAEQTFLWTFSQFVLGFAFVGITTTINLISSTLVIPLEIKFIVELSGLLVLVLVPFFVSIQFRGFLP